MRSVIRGGRYYRLANPEWTDPLEGSYAKSHGARWNSVGTYPVVYLNRTRRVARANVLRRYGGYPYSPADFGPEGGPDLVETDVASDHFVDVVTGRGCLAAGLPASYPLTTGGAEIGWETCQTIGKAAWDAGSPGVACRTAAMPRPPYGEELAWFDRGRTHLPLKGRLRFEEWF